MPWKKVSYLWVGEDGRKQLRYRDVWVPEPAKRKKAPGAGAASNSADRRRRAAAEAKRRAAQSAAERVAAQKKAAAEAQRRAKHLRDLQLQRRTAYENLKARQQALARASGLVKDNKQKPLSKPRPHGALQYDGPALPTQKDLERYKEQNYIWRRQQAIKNAKAGDAKSAKGIESFLSEEEKRAIARGTVSSKDIEELRSKYEEHATSIYDRYRAQVAAINGALDKKDVAKARSLYNSAGFKALQAEFTRLFGNGKNPLKDGSYSTVQKQLSHIGDLQREWMARQIRESLELQRRRLRNDPGHEAQLKLIEEQLGFLSGDTPLVQDGYKVVIGPGGKKKAVPKYRKATFQEAVEQQYAKLEAQRQKAVVDRLERDKRIKITAMKEGMALYNGAYVPKQSIPMLDSIKAYVAKNPGINTDFKSSDQLQNFADGLVSEWTKANPRPPRSAGVDAYQRWQKRYDAYQKQVYGFFGSSVPQWYERLLQVPGISHAMAVIQGAYSGISGLGRVAIGSTNYALSGGTNNESGIYLGPTASDLPSHQSREYQRILKEYGLPAARAYYKQFLDSADGQKWAAEHRAAWVAKQQQDLSSFYDSFYGGSNTPGAGIAADPGKALAGLNTFGADPTSDAGANLMLSLVLDPTNAIPIKFTTWAARGAYAAQATKGLSKTRALWERPKVWLTVDEATLRLEKQLKTLDKELATLGLSPEQAADMLRERIAGITDKAAKKSAINDFARLIGLDPRKVNESQLYNLIEEAAIRLTKDRHIPLLTESDAVAKHLREVEEAASEAKRARAEAATKASDEAAAETRKRFEDATRDREALAAQRLSQEEELVRRAEAAAARNVDLPEAPKVDHPAPEAPKVDHTVPGPNDSAPMFREHRRVLRDLKRYDPADEYYTSDRFGNRLPPDFKGDAAYGELVKKAAGGDADARQQLIQRARQERNRWRMQQEDIARAGDRKYKPTSFDLAERAGTVDDAKATERVLRDRNTIQHLKSQAARDPKRWEWVSSWRLQRRQGVYEPEAMVGGKLHVGDDFDEAAHIAIGSDIADAAATPRGTKDLYDTFSHGATQYYPNLAGKDLSTISPYTVKRLVVRLNRLIDENVVGPAVFRDNGQLLFEVFHQLRLAKKWDELREISDFMTLAVGKDPDNVWAWMWKTMEERSVLPYAMAFEDLRDGFLHAAEQWNLHPELAWSTIPSGYRAARYPYRFGLTARLTNFMESTARDIHMPGKEYKTRTGLNEITRMLLHNEGEPTRVLMFVAERFGQFFKDNAPAARLKDEITYAAARAMGGEELAYVLTKYAEEMPPEYIRSMLSQPNPDVLKSIATRLDTSVQKFGTRVGNLRPTFEELRGAMVRAYDAGELRGITSKGHTMMFLARMQTDPDGYVRFTRSYLMNMRAIGELTEGQRLVRELFDNEITTDILRAVHGGDNVWLDPPHKSRLAVWREFDILPDPARLKAASENWSKRAKELEDEFDVNLANEAALATERDLPGGGFAGDTIGFTQNVRSIVDDIAKVEKQIAEAKTIAQKKKLQGTARALNRELYGKVRGFINRLIDDGGRTLDNEDFESVVRAIAEARRMPGVKAIFDEIQKDLGIQRLDRLLDASGSTIGEAIGDVRHKLKDEVKSGLDNPGKLRLQRQLDELQKARKSLPDDARKEADAVAGETEATLDDAAATGETYTPTADPARKARYDAVGSLYSHIFDMSESEWLKFEKDRAFKVLRDPKATPERKAAASAHLARVSAAEYAIKVEKSSGTYAPWEERFAHARRVDAAFGHAVEQVFAPKMVAPFVQSAADAVVEEFRTYWRLLKTSASGPVLSPVHGIRHNGDLIDHIPRDVWEQVEARVTEAIAEARGWRSNVRVRGRFRGTRDESEAALGALRDKDPIVLEAKDRALFEFGRETGWVISRDAYDEARKALWKGFIQNKSALGLLSDAKFIVGRFGGDLEDVYLRLRDKEARRQARIQLRALARDEMFGHDPKAIFDEFMARWSDDTEVRHFTPQLSTFQRRTLEEHAKSLAGIDALDERAEAFLQTANLPPFSARDQTRKFLQRIGAWSPRTREAFETGARSWNIWEEAEYWRTTYGMVPEWADPKLYATDFQPIFHDQAAYAEFMRKHGVFNRSMELKLRLDGKTAKEIEDAVLHGDATLDIPARRELELQRRFVIERYGSLVSKDGVTLDAMPWLMHKGELERYMASRHAAGLRMADGLIQNADELAEVERLIEQVIGPYMEKYVYGPAAAGAEISYHDMFRVAAEVQAQLLANPKWARRYRDILGNVVNRWAWFNRWLVFSNPAFLVTNAVDVPVKSAWFRYSRRSLFNPDLARHPHIAALVDKLDERTLGMDATTAMYRVRDAKSWERFRDPRGYTPAERAVDRALSVVDFTGEVFPTMAGHIEQKARITLAKQIYPSVYVEAFARLGNEELADVFARNFVRDEVNTLWPTAGHGPIERLWNKIAPFASYNARNKVMFIAEALAHPAVLNYINRIGAYIEEENLKNWERDHPGTEMPPHLRRRIELPWAKGYYFDLSSFSDASRGLKPIFDAAQTKKSMVDWTANWVRLVNPSVQAGFYALLNAYGVSNKTAYIAVLDENGFPTGEYKYVTVPFTEPWSKDQPDLSSIFWFSQLMETHGSLAKDGWTEGELSVLFGQALFFNAVSTFDRGSMLSSFYYSLREKDPAGAKAFLLTPDGQYLQDWWESKAKNPVDVMNAYADLEKNLPDPSDWFFSQTPETRDRIAAARERIGVIRDAYAARLLLADPGTKEYRELKAQMYYAINQVYEAVPELMAAEVWGKSASQWSKSLGDWQTDKLMDTFMDLSRQRPKRESYKTYAAYQKAVDAWQLTKQTFLQQYPQVAARLDNGRQSVEALRDRIEKEWDDILTRTFARQGQIDAAKRIIADAGRNSAAGKAAQERLDILYLQNELDYSLLERDNAASYFSKDDFARLPKDAVGPPTLKGDFIKRTEAFFDFDRRRYEKAVKEGKGMEFLRDTAYNVALREAIRAAKGGDPLGEFDPAKFIKAVKNDPQLRREYFKKNPGKQEQWAQTDEYIRRISVWGKLVGAGRWDEANRAWDSLPQWVKDRYYAKHPDRRARAQQTAQYLGYMKRWVSFFEKNDTKGGMDYFRSLPKWAQDRYFAKHPEKRAEWMLTDKMGAKLRDYYAGRKEDRAEFLRQNPDLSRWFSENGNAQSGNTAAIYAAYRSIPKEEAWLRKVFRDRYPEVFSQEAKGQQRLRRVYDQLAAHPDVLPEFQSWVDAIWSSYEQMLRHAPRPANSYYSTDRKVPARAYRMSLSAAEFRKLRS